MAAQQTSRTEAAVEAAPTAVPAALAPAPVPPAPAPHGARRHLPPRPAIVVVALLALGVWAGYQHWLSLQPPGPLTASGTVEADEVVLSAEVTGRLVELGVEEGRSVRAADVVARLDDALIQQQLLQADAAPRRQLELQADRYQVRSPSPGTVLRVVGHVGEVVGPGAAIATVADLAQLKLTLYVLERDLGRVQVGQAVAITADPYPGRTFEGRVTAINSRAEFTPRNVQTQRDRQNLVFGVRVRVANPDRALKPGLPVDATFLP